MKSLNVIASIVFLGMVSYSNAAMHEMFPQEPARGGMALAPQAAVAGADAVRSRVVPLAQTRVLPAVSDQAAYPFFADAAYTTTVTRVSHGFGNAEIVEGKTTDTGIKSLTIYTPEGIRHEIHGAQNGLVYVAVSLPDGTMMMQEFDPLREPCRCGNDDAGGLGGDTTFAGDKSIAQQAMAFSLMAAGDTEVDLMMVFDTAAANWAQNTAGGVSAFANSAVNRMNTALSASGITCAIRLVGTYQPNYTANNDFNASLTALQQGSGNLSGVNAQRAAYGADVVSMMIDTGSAYGTTGLGYVTSSASYAFSVCAVQSVNISHTMTHEVGHNFGCGHSRTQSSGPGPSGYAAYAAGYYFTGNNSVKYHTIMGYNSDGYGNSYSACGMFSTPSIYHQGVLIGDAALADNARVIRERMVTMAGFRPTVTQNVTVTFDAQSGTVSPASQLYAVGLTYGYLPTPIRGGHTFDGWYTGTLGSGTKITTASIALSTVTILYAKWLVGTTNDNFLDAFILNGASGSTTVSNNGATIENGEPTNWGASDTGSVWWKWTAPSSGPYVFNTVGSSFDTLLTIFTGNALSSLTQVAYDDDGGGAATSALTLNAVAGTTYHIRVAGYRATGTIVLNWSQVTFQIDSAGEFVSSTGVSGAVPIMAVNAWNVTNPSGATWITYGSASGSGNATFQFTVAQNNTGALRSASLTFTSGTQTHNYEIIQNSLPWHDSKNAAMSAATSAGKKVLLVGGSFTCTNTRNTRTVICERDDVKAALKAGYVLWYCNVDNSSEHVTYLSGIVSYTLPLICIIDPSTPSVYQDRTTGSQTAVAILPRLVGGAGLVMVTFDAQNGGASLPSIYAKPGATYGELPAPTRTGYTFAGWNTAASGSGSPVSAQTTVTISSDHTLYGRWTPTGVASLVTFNAQGGNVSPASKTVYQGAAYDALPIPTWAGHLFAGWHTAANGGSRVINSTLVSATADHSLYAKWTSIAPNATVYYVDASCADDSGGGTTPASAKKILQSAIGLAKDGDAVLVLDGIYAPISTTNKNIIIQSMNGAERTIIDGNNSQRCATLGSVDTDTSTTLTGFTLRRGRVTGNTNFGGGTFGGTINECVFTNNYAAYHGGGSAYGIINRCKFVDNEAYNWGGGSYFSTATNSLYLRNKGYYGGGAYNGTLINCTVKDNSARYDTTAGGGTRSSTVRNSIIWGNTAAGADNNGSSGVITYTCTSSPSSSDTGNISSDPLFADAEGRLAQNSPCKNAGSNSYAVGGFDLDGNARIQGITVDMGAYEIVTVTHTSVPETPVPVEYAWINQYYTASTALEYINIATNNGLNGIPVWQSYVACLNPTNPASKFVITSITFTNGVPYFTCDPYRPDIRDYEVLGGTTLDNVSSWDTATPDPRFFKVKVLLR